MIPKIIHYCWFGGERLPELALKCIASWREFCPDYKIIEWNESNFNVNCCAYVSEAFEAKKWAFVSDYARFKILFENGGLYFDTDVELIKSVDDIVENGPFMGMESDDKCTVNAGLGLGADSGLYLYKEILDYYKTQHFINGNGSLDLTTVVVRITDILKKKGLRIIPGIQHISGISIYPQEYFCPYDCTTGETRITDNTRSIHHYSASWCKRGSFVSITA